MSNGLVLSHMVTITLSIRLVRLLFKNIAYGFLISFMILSVIANTPISLTAPNLLLRILLFGIYYDLGTLLILQHQ